MLIAVFVYYFVFYCSLDLTIKGSSLAELIVTRICILFTLLFIIFFTFNYQGIQSHITIFKDKNKPLAVLNVVIIDLVAVAVLIVVLLIASSLLHSL